MTEHVDRPIMHHSSENNIALDIYWKHLLETDIPVAPYMDYEAGVGAGVNNRDGSKSFFASPSQVASHFLASHKSFPCKSKSSHKSFGQTSSQVKSQVSLSKYKSSRTLFCPVSYSQRYMKWSMVLNNFY